MMQQGQWALSPRLEFAYSCHRHIVGFFPFLSPRAQYQAFQDASLTSKLSVRTNRAFLELTIRKQSVWLGGFHGHGGLNSQVFPATLYDAGLSRKAAG